MNREKWENTNNDRLMNGNQTATGSRPSTQIFTLNSSVEIHHLRNKKQSELVKKKDKTVFLFDSDKKKKKKPTSRQSK